MTIGILVLAGGRANRFGSDKRLAKLPGGKTVIETTVDMTSASGLPVLVCLRQTDDSLADLLRQREVPFHHCQRAAEGMGGTLAEGVTQVASWDGLLVALADMPWVKPATFRTIADQVMPDTICIPTCSGKRGHPVGFGKDFFPELSGLSGDQGARELLSTHQDRVVEIELTDSSIHRDIDLPQDLTQ